MATNKDNSIIIYDGGCKLCQQAVKFLKTENTPSRFKFIPSSDSASVHILEKYHLSPGVTQKTVVFIQNEKIFTKSTAVIMALISKGGFGRFARIFLIIPSFIRNLIYDFIAKSRK